jgi:hypothetical protein
MGPIKEGSSPSLYVSGEWDYRKAKTTLLKGILVEFLRHVECHTFISFGAIWITTVEGALDNGRVLGNFNLF